MQQDLAQPAPLPILSITPVYPPGKMVPPSHVPRDGHPLNYAACKHSDETPSITVSKVGPDKFISMMDSLETTSALLEIQYDTGCQFSLISKSVLQLLPADSCSLGNSSRINLLDFTGQCQLCNATEVKLNLYNLVLKLVVVDANLHSGSTYLFPTPYKWRAHTGHNVTSHSGRVFILLGGDNFLNFPSEVEVDKWGAGLFKSIFSYKFIIFGSVNPSTITWSKPVDIINTVCTKSLTVLVIKGQLLPNKYVENKDNANHGREIQIQEIQILPSM